MKIVECINCSALVIIRNVDSPFKCGECGGSAYRTPSSHFVLQCPLCLEYWSKRVLQLVNGVGVAYCPSKDCNGKVRIKNEWDVIKAPQNARSQSDTLIAGNSKVPSTPVNKDSDDSQSKPASLSNEDDLHIGLPLDIKIKLKPKFITPVSNSKTKQQNEPQPSSPPVHLSPSNLSPQYSINIFSKDEDLPIKKIHIDPKILENLDRITPNSIPKQNSDESRENLIENTDLDTINFSDNLLEDDNLVITLPQSQGSPETPQTTQTTHDTQSLYMPASQDMVVSPDENAPEIDSLAEVVPENPEEISQNLPLSYQESLIYQEFIDQTPKDTWIDLNALSPQLKPTEIFSLFNQLLNAECEDLTEIIGLLPFSSTIPLLQSVLLTIDDLTDVFIEEAVQQIYYIGDLRGDFHTLQQILRYFTKILPEYPKLKIVFLGNYMVFNTLDVATMVLLTAAISLYPENIVFLRGYTDSQEFLDDSHFLSRIFQVYYDQISLDGLSEDIINSHLHNLCDSIGQMYRLILQIYARLPIFHIATMNQGKIGVYASSSGLPVDSESYEDIVVLSDDINEVVAQTDRLDDLDDLSWNILMSVPGIDLDEYFDPGENESLPQFGVKLFYSFLKDNNLHYMVRAHDILPLGYQFLFNNLCCTLFSARDFDTEKAFSLQNQMGEEMPEILPKILRLTPGQAPHLIDVDESSLAHDLKEKYGIE